MISNTKVINFFGGPGSGKSTSAAGLFSILKSKKVNVELVQEFAKEAAWDESFLLLENQIHVFGEQFRRQFRLIDKVDYIITDSPLLLSSVYFEKYFDKSKQKLFSTEFKKTTIDYFDLVSKEFNNINFFIRRNKEFSSYGRVEKEDEAKELDEIIYQKLISSSSEFYEVFSTNAIGEALKFIK